MGRAGSGHSDQRNVTSPVDFEICVEEKGLPPAELVCKQAPPRDCSPHSMHPFPCFQSPFYRLQTAHTARGIDVPAQSRKSCRKAKHRASVCEQRSQDSLENARKFTRTSRARVSRAVPNPLAKTSFRFRYVTRSETAEFGFFLLLNTKWGKAKDSCQTSSNIQNYG